MQFPNYFADAESKFNDAEFVIFGVPFDKTSSFRKGASKAPDAIRQASWNFETFNMFSGNDITDIKIHDYGNLDVEGLSTKDMVSKLREFTSKIIDKDKFPIAIGGEHSITPGIIQAMPSDISVLCLDAHLDFRNEYENDSYNHACVIRRISDTIKIENIAILGIRSAEKSEFTDAKQKNLYIKDSRYFKQKPIKQIIDETKSYLSNKKLYLTLDIDVIDPSNAPGTSTPEPFGLKSEDVLEIINGFSDNLIGFDIVEVCPEYDFGQTALLAAKFIRYIIEKSYF